MIQNHRFGTGLNKYLSNIPFKDNSATSDKYFRVLDPPDRLYVGKTSFRIRVDLTQMVPGSTIYIDVIDSTGHTIYHGVADFIGKDSSRLIVIHTYENTPPGEATIYIAGRCKYSPLNGHSLDYNNNPDSWDYLHYPNIIWSKKVVVVPTDQNNDEVLFLTSPKVTCHERTEYFSSAPVSARKKILQSTGSESLSLQSSIQPFQYVNTSRYSTTYNESAKYMSLDPSGSQDFIQSQQTQVPEYFGFNTIRSVDLEFNKDMVGGKLHIKNPANLDTEYSASILKVIDKNTIVVDAPFLQNNEDDQLVKAFTGATDFTASYISRDVNVTTFETESFVQIDFKDLEPIAGTVDRIRVSYKPYGTFGEFISVGEFPVREQNYLVDSSSLLPDKISIIEQPLGDLSGSYGYDQYWNLTSNPSLNLYTDIIDVYTFDRGGSLYYTASSAVTASQTDYLVYLKLSSSYGITATSDTEFKLELSTRYSEQSNYSNILSDYQHQQIDVFISGAGVITDNIHNNKLNTLLKTKEFGTYIGSISTLKGNTQLDSKFYFKTIEEGQLYPIFVVRSGNGWEFKEITLSPRAELGYSPNQCKLMVPINTLKTDVELVLQLEYLSGTGKKADIVTTLYGLSFTGTGFPKDRLLSGTGIVSSSQQYSTGSYTGSFSGDFFGIPTGSPTIQYYRTHQQSSPSMTWSFGHGLSWQHPIITVWDNSNEMVIPQRVVADSVYASTIYFPIPVAGVAVATIGSIMPTGSLHYDNLLGKPTLISSSQQIASDISGSWRIVSSSIASEKLNRIGENAVTSSGQINIYQIQSSSFHTVSQLYAFGTGSIQSGPATLLPVKWASSPFIYNADQSAWISGSYIKLPTPGVYEIDSNVKLSISGGNVEFMLATDPNGVGTFVTQSLFSGSIGSDLTVRMNYLYETTGSNDRVGFWWISLDGHQISAETTKKHSYFKVIRLKTT